MASFYQFSTWIFSFFLFAIITSIYFYARKFVRLFNANRRVKQVAIKQPSNNQKEVKETFKSNILIPIFMPWKKVGKTKSTSKEVILRNPPDKSSHDPFRHSDASIGSFDSTTTSYSAYQEPDIDSVIDGDHSNRYSIFLPSQSTASQMNSYTNHATDRNRNIFPTSDLRTSTPKITRITSESSKTWSKNYNQNNSKLDASTGEPPAKDLGLPSEVVMGGRTRLATVAVKSSASVREVITKNESSLERIMITESLQQQKRLERI